MKKRAWKKPMPQLSFHVKRGDTVYVLSGKLRGQSGLIRQVLRNTNRVVLELLGGAEATERTVHVSNVKLQKGEVPAAASEPAASA
jgi:ribosomal protein L24